MLICALVIAKYVRISLNLMQEVPPPLSMKVRDFRPIAGDDVEFVATDGLRLRGTMCIRSDRRKPPRGLIVFAPEFKADRDSMARYGRPLWDAGYDIFSFDFRNHGESAEEPGYNSRQWASDREIADINGAFVFVESWLAAEGRPVEYGLFGMSRGACAGLVAAAQRPQIKAIISDGAFSSARVLEQMMKRYAEVFASVELLYRNHPPEFWRFLRWCVFAAYRRRFGVVFPCVQKAVSRMIPRPMLFIHGARDSYITESQSRLLYAVAPQPRELWIVAKAKHNQAVVVQPEEYARRTVDFFDLFLAGCPRPDNTYRAGRLAELMKA
jgi:pimeloyl-ACP methyl ester carboxylesterase